jgi:hypothetical protein
MKKIYITTTLFIAFTSSTFSQVNTYFQNDPVWQINVTSYPTGGPDRYEDLFNYYVNGDTTIGGSDYVKIFKKGIYSHYDGIGMLTSSNVYTDTNPSFYLRSAAKQVFILSAGGAPEELLYDFNLAIGDTIAETQINSGYPPMTVTLIDSISTSFGYLKRFHLNTPDFFLYEGCGSSGGLIEELGGLFLSGTNELNCYGLNNIGYFPVASGSCELALGINKNEKKLSSSVFPNPFSESAQIEFRKNLNNSSIKVYNAQGKLVKNISFSGNKIVIHRNELKAGLYLYHIESENEISSQGKFVITD